MNELEFVFQRIIEIDDKVVQLKVDTGQKIQEKNLKFQQEMKKLDEKQSENVKIELEKKHDKVLQQAKENGNLILREAEGRCKNMLEKYSTIKDPLKEKILKDIIASELR